MHHSKPIQGIILPVLVILVTSSLLGFSMGQDRAAYSQSSNTNSTANAGATDVDLMNTHPSPLHLKAGSKFEIFSIVVNNSPGLIMFFAGACDSPLSAHFTRNVMIKHSQGGCTATSPPFKLHPGEEVSVAGPGPGAIYQALAAGQTTANATFHYQTENGQATNVTKPFVFTIS